MAGQRHRDFSRTHTVGRMLRISDELLRRLRRRAADEGRTLQDVTNEALRRGLEVRRPTADYRLALRGWEARLRSTVDLTDRGSLLDAMEDATEVRALDDLERILDAPGLHLLSETRRRRAGRGADVFSETRSLSSPAHRPAVPGPSR